MKRICRSRLMCGSLLGIATVVLAGCEGSTPGDENNNGSTSNPVVIFNNGNAGAVLNNPISPTTFTIQQSYRITLIRNYHWNDGAGTAAAGTIGLIEEFGTTYGPWQAAGTDAMNSSWECYPEEIIPPGTYTVVDSDPVSWSQNPSSGNAGMSYIEGIPVGGGGDNGNDNVDTGGNENLNANGNDNANENGNTGDGGGDEGDNALERIMAHAVGVSVSLSLEDDYWSNFPEFGGTASMGTGPWLDDPFSPLTWAEDYSFSISNGDEPSENNDIQTIISGQLSSDGQSIITLEAYQRYKYTYLSDPDVYETCEITINNLPLDTRHGSEWVCTQATDCVFCSIWYSLEGDEAVADFSCTDSALGTLSATVTNVLVAFDYCE